MKYLGFFALVLLVTIFDSSKCDVMEFRLDNFDTTKEEKWNMTYYTNKEHCKAGGPIFIIVNLNKDFLTSGQFYDLAKENNGCLFSAHIRFYDYQFPKEFLSKVEYLNVDQIVEDLAYFVQQLKAINPELKESKVVFGGDDLAGSFIVWFKQKYPKLVDAAWVSNAAILAQMEVPDYDIIESERIRKIGGRRCQKGLKKGMSKLKKLFFDENIDKLQELFKFCRNYHPFKITDEYDFLTIFNMIKWYWTFNHAEGIKNSCSSFLKYANSLEGIANDTVYGSGDHCGKLSFSYYVSLFSISDIDFRIHQRLYQSCNEFGWWPGYNSHRPPFGVSIPMHYNVRVCSAIFGEKYTEEYMRNQIEKFNEKYNRFDTNVYNIFFMHSDLFSLRSLTHLNSIAYPDDVSKIVFAETDPTDSDQLIAARKEISELITFAIKEPEF